ncbi:MAG: 3-deoxy-manno-octulosonate cytidylyltransferase [Candidatus Omnitrophica bacterium]|nr:3-deoxy-manno-octulosonate cytidylyltransferase [Candidatus Omnitrophota bacterium]
MKTIGVIPARWGSTRFEGKVLAPLAGKPMVQHVWERVKGSALLDDVLIACDDRRVYTAAKNFGANVVLTSSEHPSGTDRIAEAVEDLDVDVVINIQGDEPLIQPQIIDALAEALQNDSASVMATVIKLFGKDEDVTDPNIVKVVVDQFQYALYFSRSVIPYNRDGQDMSYYKHLGLYAYRKDFLLMYRNFEPSRLESIEKLEQLRVLEAGYRIKTVVTDVETCGVDTPEDLIKVEARLKELT